MPPPLLPAACIDRARRRLTGRLGRARAKIDRRTNAGPPVVPGTTKLRGRRHGVDEQMASRFDRMTSNRAGCRSLDGAAPAANWPL